MIDILLLSNGFPEWPIFRQTPENKGIWNNCKFYLNNSKRKYDFCVVLNELSTTEIINCSPENTIFITGEPPIIKNYETKFLNQFSTVFTFRNDIIHENIFKTQPALPWWVGMKRIPDKTHKFKNEYILNYDKLNSMKKFLKTKMISTITSNKSFTEKHRKRISFVSILSNHFKQRLDVFGNGINSFEDKWDVIVDYKYHITLENCSYSDYWTEKLSDVFLAGTYPFYYGCPNLSKYFPKTSFSAIDIEDPEYSISLIEKEISNKRYEKSINIINGARVLVLDKYNIFSILSNYCSKIVLSNKTKKIILKPESKFGRINRIFNKIF